MSSGTAPIFSLTDDARAESAAWAQFSAAKDSADFCAGWLAILCSQIEHVNGALVVLGPDPSGSYGAAAVWPDATRDMKYLGPVAERTLKERRGLVEGRTNQPTHVGYPIEVSGTLHGAVVLDIQPRPDHGIQRVLRLMHWASAWLVDRFRQQALATESAKRERLSIATGLIATALQERRLGAAALAVANEVANQVQCDRVSIGFERKGSIDVAAISHTATFDKRTDLVRSIADAMDEVLDLNIAVVHPPSGDDSVECPAHAHLARQDRNAAVCSIPLQSAGHVIGVLTLERDCEPFDSRTVDLAETLGLLMGPILDLKRENERGLWLRLRDGWVESTRTLWGPGHPGAKMIALIVLIAAAIMALVDVPYRVTSKTVIEGAVQRSIVAPFDSFVAQSTVRAGDTVKRGQVLCTLDDRNLKLERVRWAAERGQADRKFRQAAAMQDRSSMLVFAAQIEQAQAQLDLVDDKLARATLVAPFDGVVVSGDLSQMSNAPVEIGKVLFEVAPLDAYRVILQVDERDVSELRIGQRGELAVSSIARETMQFSVSQITSISTSRDGRNFFRVEAALDKALERLRPGMEGVGKVLVGERNLWWVWTHSLVDWLRLWVWKWWI